MKNNKADCYNGNFKIKRAGVIHHFTQWEIEELVRCRNDITYFFSNYVKIVQMDRGLVHFKPYDFQKEMVSAMDRERFSLFLLPRQMGKSVTVAAFLLHQALFVDRSNIAVLANKSAQAREILARVKLMYEELPWFLQPGVVTWNKGDIELSNGSIIFSAATTGSSIRGKACTLVYMDEFAFVENDLEFYTSTYPTISSGKTTKIVITSTPNGMNLFYKLCIDAKEGRSNFAFREFHWWDHPDRDERWKEEQLNNMTPEQFAQEYENQFHGSSNTLISGPTLQRLVFSPPINNDRFFNIYEYPVENHSYVLTVDTSEGVGQDYSFVNVIDVTERPFKQVAKYRSNIIPPLMLAEVVNRIGEMYNKGVVVIESNSVGASVAHSLWHDYEYENILTTKVHRAENKEFSGAKSELGVRSTKRTKMMGCAQLKAMIEGNSLILKDFDTISELGTFTKQGTTYKADKGKNDDGAMTLVIFAWFTSQPYFADMTDINVREMLRNNLSAQDDFQAIVGFFHDGLDNDY